MRCYHCKKAIYSTIKAAALKEDSTILADGTNLDDTREHGPGLKAARELHIHHPFKNAIMNKADIRKLGRLLNMINPERPSDSCLATRIPEQTPITESTLSVISAIEKPLRPLVKGRLRARAKDMQITLDYEATDKDLVKAHTEALQAIASERGYSLCFHTIPSI